jgi:hypothetical protein
MEVRAIKRLDDFLTLADAVVELTAHHEGVIIQCRKGEAMSEHALGLWIGQRLEAMANRDLMAAVNDLLAALEAVEWVTMPNGHGDSDDRCPWCLGYYIDDEELDAGIQGHKFDCQRQAAIARAKGESNS